MFEPRFANKIQNTITPANADPDFKRMSMGNAKTLMNVGAPNMIAEPMLGAQIRWGHSVASARKAMLGMARNASLSGWALPPMTAINAPKTRNARMEFVNARLASRVMVSIAPV